MNQCCSVWRKPVNIYFVYIYIYIYIYIYVYIYVCDTYTILSKVLAPPSNERLDYTLVISMSTNLNVSAYNDIVGNLIV